MKKLSVAFLTLVLVSACGGGSGGSSSGGAGGGNSAPLITSGNTFSVAEGSTSIGTVSATDADGDNLTFTLSGVDAGAISIGSSSGALSFNAPADYENPAAKFALQCWGRTAWQTPPSSKEDRPEGRPG